MRKRLSTHHHRYASLEPLHELWKSYMSRLLPAAGEGGAVMGGGSAGTVPEERLLMAADLHGSLMRVASSVDVRHVGAAGIVAAITRQAVCLVSAAGELHG